jgi:hypothetical protein
MLHSRARKSVYMLDVQYFPRNYGGTARTKMAKISSTDAPVEGIKASSHLDHSASWRIEDAPVKFVPKGQELVVESVYVPFVSSIWAEH